MVDVGCKIVSMTCSVTQTAATGPMGVAAVIVVVCVLGVCIAVIVAFMACGVCCTRHFLIPIVDRFLGFDQLESSLDSNFMWSDGNAAQTYAFTCRGSCNGYAMWRISVGNIKKCNHILLLNNAKNLPLPIFCK
ncbi:MAG: hypothetical protein COC23_03635 [Hyphomicrobiales bacterium]|nr:MAG: hypothetical protein COC23_03635 [Hyphomicrobiales bacterium]